MNVLLFAVIIMVSLIIPGAYALDYINTYEAFIPIGRSPGLSGVCTEVGTVTQIYGDSADGSLIVLISDEDTSIWLVGRGEPPVPVDYMPVFPSTVVEVKGEECCRQYRFRHPDGGACKYWVKIDRGRESL